MSTPEGTTKARIKRLLKSRGIWFYMPVQTGYGNTELDFICARPVPILDSTLWEIFYIEAKAHKEDPTARQELIIAKHREEGRIVFVCDDQYDALRPKHDSLVSIAKWLDRQNNH